MRVLGLFLFCLALPLYASTTVTTQIHDVDVGLPGEKVLVYLTTGDVVKISQSKLSQLQKMRGRTKTNWFTITLSDERDVLKISRAATPASTLEPVTMNKSLLGPTNVSFVPTTVESYAKAKEYMAESRRPSKPETQCFNRAMVWTYEWWKNHSLKSNKILIFWSKEYVRKNEFKWWFHIAPYIHVVNPEGNVVERVMDVKYNNRPYGFQEWANFHSKVDAPCMVIDKYTDFSSYPYGHSCYLYRTNMYTYQPADLEMLEAWNYRKLAFNMKEVKAAYLEAFDLQF